jgi:hypothetical protein
MSGAEQSQPSEIGIAEAADRMAALMGGPEAEPAPAKSQPAPAETEEVEASAEDVEETPSYDGEAAETDEVEASSEEDATEPAEDDEDSSERELSDDTLVTVKIDGKTQQITLKEAREGYQRQSDYSRNMNALREEKQEVEAAREQAKILEAQYAQLIPALRQQLEQMMPQEPDWEKLHREDPLNYPLIRDQWRDYQERLAATRAEQERLSYLRQQEEQTQLRKIVEEGQKWLTEKNPEWRDAKKWDEARSKLKDYGRKIGYTDEELAQAYDPRALLVLDKARKYDELMANRPKPQKQEGPKPMKAGTAASSPRKTTEITRMKQRLAKTGSVDDAAAFFGLLDSRR